MNGAMIWWGLVILEMQRQHCYLYVRVRKVENISNLLYDLVEKISGQGVASVIWLLLLTIIKCEDRNT